MSTTINKYIAYTVTSTAPTGQTGITYVDDGTNTDAENVFRVYDGSNYNVLQRLPESVVLSEQQTAADGGGYTANTEITRTLNTKSPSSGRDWISLASNIFTIDGATYPGNYLIEWWVPGSEVVLFVSWLESSSTVIMMGSSTSSSSVNSDSKSYGVYYAAITSSTDYEIIFRASSTRATYGLGIANNQGSHVDTYTVVKITKFS